MARQISIVMYHYVHELKASRYPLVKGLSVDAFKEQLDYVMKHYSIISMEELIASVKSKQKLPQRALLLTFDDAYIGHFKYIFPVLEKLKIQGSFFPSAKAILENKVLDVNKIHFVLASVGDKSKLIKEIFSALDKYISEYSLKKNQYYFKKLAKSGRFDSGETIFIKRILQRELPEGLRQKILQQLFNKYVTADEEAFSEELYMNVDQIAYMKKKGMHIGSHGFDHCWLTTLNRDAQKREIDLSLRFLQKIDCTINEWAMCYPYGAYNDFLLSLLKSSGCAVGLSTRVGIADLDTDNPLTLPRLDTTDLPGAAIDHRLLG